MKKTIYIVIAALFLLIIIAPNKMADVFSGKKEVVKNINFKDQVPFDYQGNMKILNFNGKILSFDGKKLIQYDWNGKQEFELQLKTGRFSMQTKDKNIYVLGLTDGILYKISNSGEIISQSKILRNARNFTILKDNYIAVTYTTDVDAEGVKILDKNLQEINDFVFSDSVITSVVQNPVSEELMVGVLAKNQNTILSKLFVYDKKMQLTSTENFKNTIICKILCKDNQIMILDPDKIIITDRAFTKKTNIISQDGFGDAYIKKDRIYVKDGHYKVEIYNLAGEKVDENIFKDDINNILFAGEKVVYVSDNKLYLPQGETTTQMTIQEAIALNNKAILLIFRNGFKIIEV